eukprot:Skav230736  [mRNA]  locus=scaffold401:657673:658524:+ [translate_table: standard]
MNGLQLCGSNGTRAGKAKKSWDPLSQRSLTLGKLEKEATPEKPITNAIETHGFLWDPVSQGLIELYALKHHGHDDQGVWTAVYEALDGHCYSLTRLSPEDATPKPPPTPVVGKVPNADKKIQYQPVDKVGAHNFSENAWPKNAGSGGESPGPSGSGLESSDKSKVPNAKELAEERLRYPDQPGDKTWLGAAMMKDLGDKPTANIDPMGLEVLQGMSLTEHVIHSRWYSSATTFKAKIHPGISQELWGEIVEIFKMVNVYGITKYEVVFSYLRKQWASKHYGTI